MKLKKIFDPIHKYMEFEPELIKIIDTSEFQRLRDIKQLGLCYYVFSGASHNRFEHSLGVAHLSGMLIKRLKQNQPELNITDRQVLLVKIAGLIHDLGHGPYSHFYDNIFIKSIKHDECVNLNHEGRSIIIFEHMIKKYKLNINDNEFKMIKEMINPSNESGFLYQIVANNKSKIDTDKFDYLLRDIYNLGLPYSFEYYKFIDNMKVIDNTICYSDKLVYDIYDLFSLRLKLHKNIYNHHTVNSIELMLLDIFNLANNKYRLFNRIFNIDEFIMLNDNIIDLIYYCYIDDKDIDEAKKIIKDIKERKLYKLVDEILVNKKDIPIGILKKYNDFKDNTYVYKFFTINYCNGINNPIKNIDFYNKDTKIKINYDNISKIIPNIFEEIYLRIYKKN